MAECVYCERDPDRSRNRDGIVEDDWCEESPDGEHHEEPLMRLDPRELLEYEQRTAHRWSRAVTAGVKDPWS